MEELKNKIEWLYDLSNKYTLKEYNSLIKQCANNYEMSAVVFLYDNMKHHNIMPTKETYTIIDTLHSKTCIENYKIQIKDLEKHKLKSRRRIHKIMKGYHYSDNYKNALQYTDKVKKYILENPSIKDYYRIKLAKTLSKKCHITFDEARYIITNLKKTKWLDFSGNTSKQKPITDFFKN